MQLKTVEHKVRGPPTAFAEVQVERLERVGKPNSSKAVTASPPPPLYYFQPWGASPLTWHQVCTIARILYTVTCRSLRATLHPALKPTGPARWREELGEGIAGWIPPFEFYYHTSPHPKIFEIMWLIFHHSLPVKDRLFKHGHPEVTDSECLHHNPSEAHAETISHVLFCSSVRIVWA